MEQILLRLGREQLVVIKTEREAKEENWVTNVSKEKKLLGCCETKIKTKIKIAPCFVIEETKSKDLQKKVDYITVLYHDSSELPKGWQIQ